MRTRLSWTHDRFMTGVEFSPDGRTLVTLTEDEPDYSAPIDKGRCLPDPLGCHHWSPAQRPRSAFPPTLPTTCCWPPRTANAWIVVNNSQVLVEAADTFQQLRRFPHLCPTTGLRGSSEPD